MHGLVCGQHKTGLLDIDEVRRFLTASANAPGKELSGPQLSVGRSAGSGGSSSPSPEHATSLSPAAAAAAAAGGRADTATAGAAAHAGSPTGDAATGGGGGRPKIGLDMFDLIKVIGKGSFGTVLLVAKKDSGDVT